LGCIAVIGAQGSDSPGDPLPPRVFDANGRLVSAPIEATGGAQRVAFAYDADGVRIQTTVWRLDPEQGVWVGTAARRLADPLSTAGGESAVAQVGDRGELSVWFPGGPGRVQVSADAATGGTGRVVYGLTDGRSDTRIAAEAQRGPGLLPALDAFGLPLDPPAVSPGDDTPPSSGPPWQGAVYGGGIQAGGLREWQFGARDYDPAVGRFEGLDPWEGSVADPTSRHRYLYASCDPVNRVDPSGNADYTLKSLFTAASVSATIATLDTLVATRGKPGAGRLAGSAAKGAMVGAAGGVMAPVFYAAGAGGKLAFHSYSLATAFWDLGDAVQARDAKLIAFRAFTLAIFSAAATRDPSVRVYHVEGDPNTRILVNPDGELTLQGDGLLFLNFGQQTTAEELLQRARARGVPGAVLKSFEVPRSYLRELRDASVTEEMVDLFPDRPIRVDLDRAPDQFGIRPSEFEHLLQQVREGTVRTGP
jgi:RHS repeat-associated protein